MVLFKELRSEIQMESGFFPCSSSREIEGVDNVDDLVSLGRVLSEGYDHRGCRSVVEPVPGVGYLFTAEMLAGGIACFLNFRESVAPCPGGSAGQPGAEGGGI